MKKEPKNENIKGEYMGRFGGRKEKGETMYFYYCFKNKKIRTKM